MTSRRQDSDDAPTPDLWTRYPRSRENLQGRRVGNVLWGLITAAISGLAVGQFLDDPILGLIIGCGFVWVVVAISSARSSKTQWSPLRIFIPSFVAYSAASSWLASTPTRDLELLCIGFVAVGFTLGYLLVNGAPRRNIRRPQIGSAKVTKRVYIPRLWIPTGLFFAASLVLLALVSAAGTFPALAEDSNLARTLFFPNGVTSTIVVVGYQAALVVGGSVLVLRIRPRKNSLAWVLVVGSVVALGLLGNRGMLVAPVIILALVFFWNRRIRLGPTILMALLGAALFSYAGFQRNLETFGTSYIGNLEIAGYTGNKAIMAPLLQYVAGTSETFSRTILLIPKEIPFQNGLQFFGPLLMQPSADLFLKDVLGSDFVGFGLALGMPNAFYLDWGVLGCLVGAGILGATIGFVYAKANFSDPRWILLCAYILTRLLLSLYGHPFAYLYYIVLPVIFWLSFRPVGRTMRHVQQKAPVNDAK